MKLSLSPNKCNNCSFTYIKAQLRIWGSCVVVVGLEDFPLGKVGFLVSVVLNTSGTE